MRRTVALLLLLPPAVHAVGMWSGGPCLSACQLWLSLINFEGTPLETPFLEKQCEGGLRAASLYLCAELYCPEEDTLEGLAALNASCLMINSTLPPLDIVAEYGDGDWDEVMRVDSVDPEGEDFYGVAVLPSETLFKHSGQTLVGIGQVTLVQGMGKC